MPPELFILLLVVAFAAGILVERHNAGREP
jgi:hypothetical protein